MIELKYVKEHNNWQLSVFVFDPIWVNFPKSVPQHELCIFPRPSHLYYSCLTFYPFRFCFIKSPALWINTHCDRIKKQQRECKYIWAISLWREAEFLNKKQKKRRNKKNLGHFRLCCTSPPFCLGQYADMILSLYSKPKHEYPNSTRVKHICILWEKCSDGPQGKLIWRFLCYRSKVSISSLGRKWNVM